MKHRLVAGILVLVLCLGIFLTWRYWPEPESSSQKVHRLLRQYDSLPQGKGIYISFNSRESVDAEWDRLGTEDVPALVEALDDSPCFMRYLAAGRLGKIGDTRAVPGLIRALQNDYDFVVRMWAASALGDLRDSRGVEPLIRSTEDERSGVRRAAAKALGQCGDKRGVEPLIRLLQDEDWSTQMQATEALGCLGDPRAIDPIRRMMDADQGSSRREEGQKALRKIMAENPGDS